MLRILPIDDSQGRGLKLEGKLLGPWTDELRSACDQLTSQTPRRRLDLRELSYVDAAGIELLKKLRSEGFELAACSPFVATVLHTEKL